MSTVTEKKIKFLHRLFSTNNKSFYGNNKINIYAKNRILTVQKSFVFINKSDENFSNNQSCYQGHLCLHFYMLKVKSNDLQDIKM